MYSEKKIVRQQLNEELWHFFRIFMAYSSYAQYGQWTLIRDPSLNITEMWCINNVTKCESQLESCNYINLDIYWDGNTIKNRI